MKIRLDRVGDESTTKAPPPSYWYARLPFALPPVMVKPSMMVPAPTFVAVTT